MKKKQKKKKNLSYYKTKAWALLSKINRQAYADHRGMVKCITCPTVLHWTEAHAAHYIEKKKGTAVYFHWLNIFPACPVCNIWKKEEHKRKYSLVMEDMLGRDHIEELEKLSRTTLVLKRVDYEGMIGHYETCLAVIDN